jgi:hypothetical protein
MTASTDLDLVDLMGADRTVPMPPPTISPAWGGPSEASRVCGDCQAVLDGKTPYCKQGDHRRCFECAGYTNVGWWPCSQCGRSHGNTCKNPRWTDRDGFDSHPPDLAQAPQIDQEATKQAA